jgi:hypothetical protein
MPRTGPRSIYQLKVTLCEVELPVWRRIQVPASTYLDDLHLMLQATMGWQNCHLHSFTINGVNYGEPDPDFDEPSLQEEWHFTLRQLIRRQGRRFRYQYDFGDDWNHEIVVERIMNPEDGVDYPVCVAGERACPPEDVGGSMGYEDFIEAIEDPDHEEHESCLTWVGGKFDPEAFNIKKINRQLRKYREMRI